MKLMSKDLQVVAHALDSGKFVTIHWGTVFPSEVKFDIPDVVSLDIEHNKVTVCIARGKLKEYDILSTMAFDIDD